MIFGLVGAVVIGVSLGLFGSGGSILTVPVLLYVLGHEPKVAIAESLGIVGGIALLNVVPHARRGFVDLRTALLFGIPGMFGTYAGAWVSAWVSGVVQILFFAAVMLAAAALMWRRGGKPSHENTALRPRAVLKIVGDGLAVGVLTGFVGVGGGFLIVPALVLLGGLGMRVAVGTSLLVIAMKSATGFWKYHQVLSESGVAVDWGTMGTFIALGFVGGLGGKRLSSILEPQQLARGFALFLVLMALFIGFKETAALGAGTG